MKRSGVKQSVYQFSLKSNSNSKSKDYFVNTFPRNDGKKTSLRMKRSEMKQSVYRFSLNSNSNSKNKDYFVNISPRNDSKKCHCE